MHFACFYGHLELVIYLWRRGCEINVCDNHNITPLMKVDHSHHFKNEIILTEVKMNSSFVITINGETHEFIS